MIFHILKKRDWQDAVRQGAYAPPSLAVEGFVHCSTLDQTLGTANRFFRGQQDLALLCIEPQRLHAELRFESPADPGDDRASQPFPHVYGAINLDAVTQVVDWPCQLDGSFRLPSRALKRR